MLCTHEAQGFSYLGHIMKAALCPFFSIGPSLIIFAPSRDDVSKVPVQVKSQQKTNLIQRMTETEND